MSGEIGSGWTEERIATLRRMWDEGCSCGVIAIELGVTRNTIQGKVTRLKLVRRVTAKAIDGRTYQPPYPERTPRSGEVGSKLRTIKLHRKHAVVEEHDRASERRRLNAMLTQAVLNTVEGR